MTTNLRQFHVIDQPATMKSPPPVKAGAAHAYNAAGRDYVAYADGDASRPFEFNSRYSFADLEIWRRIDAELLHLAQQGRRSLRLLDAGCGPGTWLRRVVMRAKDYGFHTIEAHGLDISPAMLTLARTEAAALKTQGIDISFTRHDLSEGIPFESNLFDITLCLYGVLNHLLVTSHRTIATELCRVTYGALFVTVRTVGSLPTIYVDTLDRARAFHQDNDRDWMDVDLDDGRHIAFSSHLFTSRDLQCLFQPHLGSLSMLGLDVFHSRFAPHPDWNPNSIASDASFDENLNELERRYGGDPGFIDRAAHILLTGEK